MFYVYGLQAVGKPENPVKIGFSAKPADRISALEPGAIGECLHAIFLTEAGGTYGDGRRVEKLYHDKFSILRINREWFRFDSHMLTWRPDGTRTIYIIIKSPAENTIPAKRLVSGDLRMISQIVIQRPNIKLVTTSGDLSAVVSVQRIVQRV